jgi:hypothetical protein
MDSTKLYITNNYYAVPDFDLNSLRDNAINTIAAIPRSQEPNTAAIDPASDNPQLFFLSAKTPPMMASISNTSKGIPSPTTIAGNKGILIGISAPLMDTNTTAPIAADINTTIDSDPATIASIPATLGIQLLSIVFLLIQQ